MFVIKSRVYNIANFFLSITKNITHKAEAK